MIDSASPGTARGSNRRSLRVAVGALLACATSALAAPTDTTWLSPVNGDFGDAARWSNGAPNTTSAAIFGASESTEAFSVAFATSPSIAALRVLSQSPFFALGVHSLALLAAEGLTIAGPDALAPTLTLSNGTLTTPKATIGAAGAGGGTLRLRDGAHFVSSSTSFGMTAPDLGVLDVRGPGTTASIGPLPTAGVRLTIGDGAMVSMTSSYSGTLSVTSSLHFEFGAHGTGLLQSTGGLLLHGAFSLTLADGYIPAPGSVIPLVQAAVVGAAFDSIDVPVIGGAPISIVSTGVMLLAIVPDTTTQLVIAPSQFELYEGFPGAASASLVYSSGPIVDVTNTALWSTADPAIATVDPSAQLFGTTVGSTTLTATYLGLSASAPITTLPVPEGLQFTRVSEAADGTGGNDSVDSGSDYFGSIAISDDGRYVAFASKASNLVEGDVGGFMDVFRKDLLTGAVERVSIAADGTPGNGDSTEPAMTPDGRFIAFQSTASNLVAGDNAGTDIFVRDMETGSIERIRATPLAGAQFGKTRGARISADGRYVAIIQGEVVPGELSLVWRVYRCDRATQTSELVSVTSDGLPVTAFQYSPIDLSADGSIALFTSYQLIEPDQPVDAPEVWLRDIDAHTLSAVARRPDGVLTNGANRGRLSPDGRFVVFESVCTNLVPCTSQGYGDILVLDRATGIFECADVTSDGTNADGEVHLPSISHDGRFVAFISSATNLAGLSGYVPFHLYLHDRMTGELTHLTQGPVGPGNGSVNRWAEFSSEGHITFTGGGSNLAPFDLNQRADVLLRSIPLSLFADLDGDGIVNATDLAILIGAWGSNSYFPDLDKDGLVGASDLGALLGAWSSR